MYNINEGYYLILKLSLSLHIYYLFPSDKTAEFENPDDSEDYVINSIDKDQAQEYLHG